MSLTQLKQMDMAAAILPTFEEVIKNKDWVFFGGDNLWAQHSVDYYNYSALNRACINAKRDAVIGKEMLINGKSANEVMFNSTETIYDVYKKVAMDYVIHNGFSLNTILNKGGDGIGSIYHMDFTKIRSGKCNEYDYIKDYYYSADWRNTRLHAPVRLSAFDLNDAENPSQVYYYFQYSPNQKYYPLNDWIGARTCVEIDIEIKNFHLNNLQNSFVGSHLISLNQGVPGEEEREMIYRHIVDAYTSTNNAGKVIMTFSDSKENEPTVIPLTQNGSDVWYSQIAEMVQSVILTSHRITKPDLLGIKTAGQLGTKQEIIEGYEHFIQTNIVPIQQHLITQFEKLCFMMFKTPVKIEIVQNELFVNKDITTITTDGSSSISE